MNLLETILGGANAANASQLGKQFGLDDGAAANVLGQLVPALSRGLQNNSASGDGLAGLAKALQGGKHQRYLDDANLLGQQSTVEDGNKILGHVFGSKDVSRNVAAQAASETGVDAGIIKKMLPLVATMVMGGLSKQTDGGRQLEAGAGGADLLGSLLGSQGGGVDLDDVVNLAKKFF